MAKTAKNSENKEYAELRKAIASGELRNLYAFYGEERYLLEYYLREIRAKLLRDGMEEFCHRKLNGKNTGISELAEAVNVLPFLSERSVVEVWDLDLGKAGESFLAELLALLRDLPDYVCIIFVYDTVEFKLDGRMKAIAEFKKLCTCVEFRMQEQPALVDWICRRYKALGKQIERRDAEYLAFIGGGLMTGILTEIEKTASAERGDRITRETIDRFVTPVLDVQIYRMTDQILKRKFDAAAAILGDLIRMREEPRRVLFNMSLKMRQLLTARVCMEERKGAKDLMEICGIRQDFQAAALMESARKVDLDWCRQAVRLCAESALKINSSTTDASQELSQLLAELALL